jgi:hypothetical protein
VLDVFEGGEGQGFWRVTGLKLGVTGLKLGFPGKLDVLSLLVKVAESDLHRAPPIVAS